MNDLVSSVSADVKVLHGQRSAGVERQRSDGGRRDPKVPGESADHLPYPDQPGRPEDTWYRLTYQDIYSNVCLKFHTFVRTHQGSS